MHHLQGKATGGLHGEYHSYPSPGDSAHGLPVPEAREGEGRKHPSSNRPLHLLYPGICHSIPDGPDNSQGSLGPLQLTGENPFRPGEEF